MTRLCVFLKVLGDKFYYKSSPNTWWTLGLLQNTIFEQKTTVTTYWSGFGKIGLFLILTTGHTADKRERTKKSLGNKLQRCHREENKIWLDFKTFESQLSHCKIYLLSFLNTHSLLVSLLGLPIITDPHPSQQCTGL